MSILLELQYYFEILHDEAVGTFYLTETARTFCVIAIPGRYGVNPLTTFAKMTHSTLRLFAISWPCYRHIKSPVGRVAFLRELPSFLLVSS